MNECFRCGSVDTLEYIEEFEDFDHDTNEPEFHSGYQCTICGCFHAENKSMVTYLCDRELYTNYNVAGWLNKT